MLHNNRDLADAVAEATKQLNRVILEAHVAGLRVDAEINFLHSISAAWGRPSVTTSVSQVFSSATEAK